MAKRADAADKTRLEELAAELQACLDALDINGWDVAVRYQSTDAQAETKADRENRAAVVLVSPNWQSSLIPLSPAHLMAHEAGHIWMEHLFGQATLDTWPDNIEEAVVSAISPLILRLRATP